MKVLSLTEPYATLIKEQKKKIETRGWKTAYRGELYIHASSTKVPKEWKENQELMNLVSSKSLNFGYIICKCQLVDCVYMDKKFIKNMKENNPQEYLCGVYEEGRYAWILENVQPLSNPIKGKGQLNIWNFYNEQEIMNIMSQIEYGWVDKNHQKHEIMDDTLSDNYQLQSPKELLKSKLGFCWDQVELERYLFQGNDLDIKTYFIVHYDDNNCPTHTFLTFQKNQKYYWFEHAWEKCRGIHAFNTEKELLLAVGKSFIEFELKNKYQKNNLIIREYKKPKYHITIEEFYHHCEQGKCIKFD